MTDPKYADEFLQRLQNIETSRANQAESKAQYQDYFKDHRGALDTADAVGRQLGYGIAQPFKALGYEAGEAMGLVDEGTAQRYADDYSAFNQQIEQQFYPEKQQTGRPFMDVLGNLDYYGTAGAMGAAQQIPLMVATGGAGGVVGRGAGAVGKAATGAAGATRSQAAWQAFKQGGRLQRAGSLGGTTGAFSGLAYQSGKQEHLAQGGLEAEAHEAGLRHAAIEGGITTAFNISGLSGVEGMIARGASPQAASVAVKGVRGKVQNALKRSGNFFKKEALPEIAEEITIESLANLERARTVDTSADSLESQVDAATMAAVQSLYMTGGVKGMQKGKDLGAKKFGQALDRMFPERVKDREKKAAMSAMLKARQRELESNIKRLGKDNPSFDRTMYETWWSTSMAQEYKKMMEEGVGFEGEEYEGAYGDDAFASVSDEIMAAIAAKNAEQESPGEDDFPEIEGKSVGRNTMGDEVYESSTGLRWNTDDNGDRTYENYRQSTEEDSDVTGEYYPINPNDREKPFLTEAEVAEQEKPETPTPTGEGETPVPTGEGETPVPTGEGETPVPTGEGETPVPTGEGETPAPTGEGETPAPTGEGETPAPTGEGETPAPTGEGETPAPTGEGETPTPTGEGETPAPTGEGETPTPTGEGETPVPTGEGETPTPTGEGETPAPTGEGETEGKAPEPTVDDESEDKTSWATKRSWMSEDEKKILTLDKRSDGKYDIRVETRGESWEAVPINDEPISSRDVANKTYSQTRQALMDEAKGERSTQKSKQISDLREGFIDNSGFTEQKAEAVATETETNVQLLQQRYESLRARYFGTTADDSNFETSEPVKEIRTAQNELLENFSIAADPNRTKEERADAAESLPDYDSGLILDRKEFGVVPKRRSNTLR